MWYICTHHVCLDLSWSGDCQRGSGDRLPSVHRRIHQPDAFGARPDHLRVVDLADGAGRKRPRDQPRLRGLGGRGHGRRRRDRDGGDGRDRERAQAREHRAGDRRRRRTQPLGSRLMPVMATSLPDMAAPATVSRREQILDAAVQVIGRSGREAVTHRAVAEEAGVPLGSTTYYFDSRDDLLGQALEHVARSEAERYAEFGQELLKANSARQLADKLLDMLISEAEDRSAYIAEYELWLEASRRPELREAATAWCDAVQLAIAGPMAKLGSTDPATDASLVVAAMDGLGERILGRKEDPAEAAAVFAPQLRRLIERLLAD